MAQIFQQPKSQIPLPISSNQKRNPSKPPKFQKHKRNKIKKTHVQTSIRPINPPPNHLPIPHKHTPHRSLVAVERKLRHLDGFAHETLMVLAVGDGAEDHFVRDGVAGEVGVWRWVGESVVVGGRDCGGGGGLGLTVFAEDWE